MTRAHCFTVLWDLLPGVGAARIRTVLKKKRTVMEVEARAWMTSRLSLPATERATWTWAGTA